MLQTSSPSALLTGSLDEACRLLIERGSELFHSALLLAERAREEIGSISGLRCYRPSELCELPGVAAADPTKLVIAAEDGAGVGPALRSLLLEDGVEPELSSLQYVVCTISFADTEATVARLLESLRRAGASLRAASQPRHEAAHTFAPPASALAMTPREAFFSPSREVDLRSAAGEVAAAPVIPYPPGIPLLLPGETITPDAVAHVAELHRQGARVLGLSETADGPSLTIVAA
jgi:arginine decarboxylase